MTADSAMMLHHMVADPARIWTRSNVCVFAANMDSRDPSLLARQMFCEHVIGSGDQGVIIRTQRDDDGRLVSFTILPSEEFDATVAEQALDKLIAEALA